MTLTRPNLAQLLLPLAVFGVLLAVLTFVNRGDADGDAPAAGAQTSRGQAYLERARLTGDLDALARAGRAFDAALQRDPRDYHAVVGAGTLAGLRHDFRRQIRLGHVAHDLAPDLVGPLIVTADGQIELGRYAAAARTVQRLLDAKPGVAAYSRASYLRELSGDPRGAAAAMRLAASAAGGGPADRAYVQSLLGDLELQRGRTAAAQSAYFGALRSVREAPAALVGLARVDASRGRFGAAVAKLRRATGEQPLTTSLTLLADVELAAGREAPAQAALAAVGKLRRRDTSAGTLPDAETVLFQANHGDPGRAVSIGRRVWRAKPSIRSADALGWALTRSGRPAAGLRWAGEALRLGSRDPLFRFHAGIAAMAAGRLEAAGGHLRIAVRGSAMLPPLQAAQTRRALRRAQPPV